jgi:hypothetical protein
MANTLLFHSSLICGMVLLYTISLYSSSIPSIVWWLIVCIIGTSLWNHGTTMNIAMICDRMAVWIGFCICIFLLSQSTSSYKHEIFIFFFLSLCLLFFSKAFSSSFQHILHVSSHILITFTLILFIQYGIETFM